MIMDMNKFLVKVFTWLSESIACEQAMYEALYESRIAPLVDKILHKEESINKLEREVANLKTEINTTKQVAETATKAKRKYNKRKKADDKA